MSKEEFLLAYNDLRPAQKFAIETALGFRTEITGRPGGLHCYAVFRGAQIVYVADTFKQYEERLYDNGYIGEKDLSNN